MLGYSKIRPGISRAEKYSFNMLLIGLSICLGLAFAAQFAQFCQMMRWRFLASSYRNLEEFDLVLGCDSMANTVRLIWKGRRKGQWYPTKSQVLAMFWVFVFVAFNVVAALLGLTYSTDVNPDQVDLAYGECT